MINRSQSLMKAFPAFGLALIVSLALAAIGAAGASALSMTPTPTEHTGSGGPLTFVPSKSNAYSCTSTSSTGKAVDATNGEMTLTFKGCGYTVGGTKVNCTSSGQATGTIVAYLKYDLKYFDAGKTKFGLRLMSKDAVIKKLGELEFIESPTPFAEFNCGSSSYKWNGNGTIRGQVTNPGLNVSASNATLALTSYLSQSKDGGSAEALSMEGTHTLSYANSITFLP